jgi:hypothetical protein
LLQPTLLLPSMENDSLDEAILQPACHDPTAWIAVTGLDYACFATLGLFFLGLHFMILLPGHLIGQLKKQI